MTLRTIPAAVCAAHGLSVLSKHSGDKRAPSFERGRRRAETRWPEESPVVRPGAPWPEESPHTPARGRAARAARALRPVGSDGRPPLLVDLHIAASAAARAAASESGPGRTGVTIGPQAGAGAPSRSAAADHSPPAGPGFPGNVRTQAPCRFFPSARRRRLSLRPSAGRQSSARRRAYAQCAAPARPRRTSPPAPPQQSMPGPAALARPVSWGLPM